jgi:chromosome segregation ATPase
MTYKHEVNLANQPALVPLFGGLDKRPRPLDRDVITIGRARGCDIGLDAPDISTLHCLLYRTAEGYRIQDCASRTGILVNGDLPRRVVLADGDILQIGPFSFTVSIPTSFRPDARKLAAERLDHYQRSRRNLVHLALNLRGRLHRASANPGDAGQAELNRKAADLRNRLRQYDHRLNQLETAERDLEADRAQLRRERDSHEAHVQQVEGESAKRLEAADQEIHARWQEFQQRCIQEEQQRSVEDRQREREETMRIQEQLSAVQTETNSFLEQQRAALSQAEVALREQRSELSRMMSDLRGLQESIKKQQGADVQALTRENEELRGLLEDYERRLADMVASQALDQSKDLENLKGENELFRQLLEEKDGLVQDLKHQVEELKNRPEAKPAAVPQDMDLESFETELNQYRQQLEVDRAKLNKEIEQLRFRNAELDEATREMEMEMSKERAELARERTRLDRMREEVRSELERVQRDATMRDSLAPVQKLREEMAQKKSGGKEDANRLNDRLHSFRNRLTDSPS